MKSTVKTVNEYIARLPADRRTVISAVRQVILANLPKGYEECMSYGMIGYVVPHSIYPAGYHCDPKLPLPYANLGSQKNHLALHLMCAYVDEATGKWFRHAWLATGKKLDMGKCCVRFKKLEDVSLDTIGQVIARVPVDKYIARIEKVLTETSRKKTGKAARPTKRKIKG